MSLRVLVLIQGALDDRMTGPAIRGWQTALAFSGRHVVTAVAPRTTPGTRDGIHVVASTRRAIFTEALRHDVVIAPSLPPYVFAALAARPAVAVADLYDPVDLELATLGHGIAARRAVVRQRASRRLQLRWADVVVCAGSAQLERARADMATTPYLGRQPALVTVPMGLPAPPFAPQGHPLRDRFPGIGPADPLVLWWGSVWRWLDAETAIEAIAQLVARLPNVRLVITAGRPPNADTDRLNAIEDARKLAGRLGLLDRHVFFFDEWVPYERRHDYIADSNVGITLHRGTPEATLAARARYMDYLWSGVPSVLARGDEVAERMAQAGAGLLVAPRDASATADALHELLAGEARRTAAAASVKLADEFRWPALMAPLVDVVERAVPEAAGPGRFALSVADAAGYYASRVVDRVVRIAAT